MRKLIAAMNMTLDGFGGHDKMTADDQIHQHYTDLLRSGDTVLYGRITFQLIEYWKSVVENPTGNKASDDFAAAIDYIQKIVYSRTLENVNSNNTELKRELVKADILQLKQQPGTHICRQPEFDRGLNALGLIDEHQLGVQPTVLGSGLSLFRKHQGWS